jgi:hypothetical protein
VQARIQEFILRGAQKFILNKRGRKAAAFQAVGVWGGAELQKIKVFF